MLAIPTSMFDFVSGVGLLCVYVRDCTLCDCVRLSMLFVCVAYVL